MLLCFATHWAHPLSVINLPCGSPQLSFKRFRAVRFEFLKISVPLCSLFFASVCVSCFSLLPLDLRLQYLGFFAFALIPFFGNVSASDEE